VTVDMARFNGSGAGRLAVGSEDALADLRRDVFKSVGPRYGSGILYGIGYTEGLIDALRVAQQFDSTTATSPCLAGPPLPLLFDPNTGRLSGRFRGDLTGSIEARLHAQRFGSSEAPVCSVTAGYAAGWYTEILATPILVKETACSGKGDSACCFEARPADQWDEDPEMAEVLPYLDIPALRERARAALASAAQASATLEDADSLATFDPSSPAVHVWGPVMILPYSGADDCSAAIDTIVGDIGSGQVRVVLLDLLGMRLDSIEAAGITQVLSYLQHHEMESILVGVSRNDGTRLGLPVCDTLCVSDMAQGIALGFQMVYERSS